MTETPSVVALIPARSGSKRVKHKNIRPLGGHPSMAYTIAAAVDSGVFGTVIVSTDSEKYADVARHYGAEVIMRPDEFATSTSPDIEWIAYTLKKLASEGRPFDAFAILRPTSPMRLPETIRRAWTQFCGEDGIDSLRAVEKVKQHPGKMWVVRGQRMTPLMPLSPPDKPWHSQQMAALPDVYVQNASLEIAWTRVALEDGTIAGNVLTPFITEDLEGLDINGTEDWWYAEHLIEIGEAKLPKISQDPYPEDTSTFGQ